MCFLNNIFNSWNDDRFDVENTVKRRYDILSIQISFLFKNGIKNSFIAQNVHTQVIEVDNHRLNALLFQSGGQPFNLTFCCVLLFSWNWLNEQR